METLAATLGDLQFQRTLQLENNGALAPVDFAIILTASTFAAACGHFAAFQNASSIVCELGENCHPILQIGNVPIADVVTTTTHKTLRGPRGGLILAREHPDLHKKLDSMIFPGTQGGPLMHVIAAKAVALLEALTPEFAAYQRQVVANARAMAGSLQERGHRIVSGGTDNHLFLLDLTGKAYTGKDADAALGRAHITVNKNAVPNDPRSPFVTSGLRIGTPAITTRGLGLDEARQVAAWIADVLDATGDEAAVGRVREQVLAICKRFPVYR